MQSPLRYLFPVSIALFAVGCLYELRGDLARTSLSPLMHSWDLVALAVLCSFLNYALRIARWQRYLAELGHSLQIGFTGLTYVAGFAFTVSPGKVGEMVRARYYSCYGLSLAEVAGAFFVERLMDVMAMIVLAALIVAAIPRYHLAIWSAGILVVVVLATLAGLPWETLVKRFEKRTRVPRLVVGAGKALCAARSLLGPGALTFGFVSGLAGWGLEGIGLYVLASIFPAVHLAPATGVGIYAVAVLVGALSFLPGGLGSTEAVMAALLAAQGYPVGEALLVTMACRIVTLWLAVLIGWAAMLILRNRTTPAVPSWP